MGWESSLDPSQEPDRFVLTNAEISRGFVDTERNKKEEFTETRVMNCFSLEPKRQAEVFWVAHKTLYSFSVPPALT